MCGGSSRFYADADCVGRRPCLARVSMCGRVCTLVCVCSSFFFLPLLRETKLAPSDVFVRIMVDSGYGCSYTAKEEQCRSMVNKRKKFPLLLGGGPPPSPNQTPTPTHPDVDSLVERETRSDGRQAATKGAEAAESEQEVSGRESAKGRPLQREKARGFLTPSAAPAPSYRIMQVYLLERERDGLGLSLHCELPSVTVCLCVSAIF
jgi:hypothetical protein